MKHRNVIRSIAEKLITQLKLNKNYGAKYCRICFQTEDYIALSTAHTSAKATDVAKLLLLNKGQLTHILPCRHAE